MKHYYLFTVSKDDDMYRGSFADFETLDTFGDTEEELYNRAGAILAMEILESEKNGLDIPKPTLDISEYKKSLGENEKVVEIEIDTDDYKHLTELGEDDD